MPTEIKLPSLGEGVESGDVLEIMVKIGDVIKKGQSIVELETDKATVSVPSPSAGKILSIAIKEGETIKIGMVLAMIEAVGAAAPAPVPAAPPISQSQVPTAPKVEQTPSTTAPAPIKPAAPIVVPPIAESGAPISQGTPPLSGLNKSQSATPDAGTPVSQGPPPLRGLDKSQQSSSEAGTPFSDDVIPAGPAIRRFAREVGVDLVSVPGTGDGGRITREDILAVVRHANQSVRSAPQAAAQTANTATNTNEAPAPKPATDAKGVALPGTAANDDYGPIRVDRMSKIRKTIAAQMHKSWSTVPRVVNFDDADITDLEAIRQVSKDDYASRGIKLTSMPFLIKAVATALKHHPALNATIDMENEQIIYKDYVNLGIAVDGEKGLVVPTLKNADRMSIPDIAYALSDLSSRVRNNSYAVSDLRGGTFTISNLGAIGGTYSTPIINVPEVAILLVGRSRKMPIVMGDDTIKPRLMMPLSLAYDHRSVDGATAARFLNDIIALLEAPSRLLLAI